MNPTGGPVLATGGSGDVLTGVVAGLLGQGLEAFEAARLGAFLHGAAADELAALRGEAGVLAGDLLEALPETASGLRRAARDGGPGTGDALAFPEPG